VRHVPHQANVAFDTSAFAGPLADALGAALALLGPHRLLLGTHTPFKYPQVGPLRVRVRTSDADDATRAAILGGNAAPPRRLAGPPRPPGRPLPGRTSRRYPPLRADKPRSILR